MRSTSHADHSKGFVQKGGKFDYVIPFQSYTYVKSISRQISFNEENLHFLSEFDLKKYLAKRDPYKICLKIKVFCSQNERTDHTN